MKATTTWVLVADGARARFFRSEGWSSGLAPALDDADHPSRPSREIGSDRPGRVVESADGARHALAPRVDWHEYEKHLFAKSIAEILNEAATGERYDRLVLVAPPKTLGELRAALGKSARERLVAAIDKDLTKASLDELIRHLEAVVPV